MAKAKGVFLLFSDCRSFNSEVPISHLMVSIVPSST